MKRKIRNLSEPRPYVSPYPAAIRARAAQVVRSLKQTPKSHQTKLVPLRLKAYCGDSGGIASDNLTVIVDAEGNVIERPTGSPDRATDGFETVMLPPGYYHDPFSTRRVEK